MLTLKSIFSKSISSGYHNPAILRKAVSSRKFTETITQVKLSKKELEKEMEVYEELNKNVYDY